MPVTLKMRGKILNVLENTREKVISTARKLMANELNFGTWGNISCRGSADRVIITPSGIPYSDLEDYGQEVNSFQQS